MTPGIGRSAMRWTLACLSLVSTAVIVPQAAGQNGKATANVSRNNPRFLAAFRESVADVRKSTVRIYCDGKKTALGMIVGPAGWILTKKHDLSGEIVCEFANGSKLPAKLFSVHKPNDLALLKVNVKGLKAVEFRDSKNTLVGSWLSCVGTGLDPVAVGIVSVATRKLPTKTSRPIISSRAGYLGVALEPNDDGGVRVTQVLPKTGAARAGIRSNDIIRRVAGQRVSHPRDVIKRLEKTKPGQVIVLRVKRGDEEFDKKITLGKRPLNRGDFQNRLGSKLSNRRSGYPVILQFDGVIDPTDCGGPVVDLNGDVIGISISRAGRTESWAIPSEEIKSVLVDMMAGRLPPPEERDDK